jgi:hypothetical protein
MLPTLTFVCYAQQIKELPLTSETLGSLDRQPEVYWHDKDLNLDIDTSTSDWSVVVTHSNGTVDHVPLPREIGLIDAVHRSAQNRAVILTEIGSGAREVVVIQTDPAKLLEKFWSSKPVSLSPDNRYVLFVRFYPMHGGEGYDDQYRLYDVLGTRSTNWPDRPAQDAPPNMPTNYDETLAGVPVYPLKAGELGRMNTFVPEGQEHLKASDFIWTADSSKVVFADVQGNIISLVVVTMPKAANSKPQTTVYPLVGDENVCPESNVGECDSSNVLSLAWDGDSVKAALLFRPNNAKDNEKDVTVPLSKFVPAGK